MKKKSKLPTSPLDDLHKEGGAVGVNELVRPRCIPDPPSFREELRELINRRSMESRCNTPDFMLAQYLCDCLHAFEAAINTREAYYNRPQGLGPEQHE